MGYQVEKTDQEWREQLSRDEYAVLRQAGTERAFTGEYTDTKTVGVYRCRACQAELFKSETKFDSHCGWPSFYAPLAEDRVEYIEDNSHGMKRVEVRCAQLRLAPGARVRRRLRHPDRPALLHQQHLDVAGARRVALTGDGDLAGEAEGRGGPRHLHRT